MPEICTTHSGSDPAVIAVEIAARYVPDIVDVLNALPPEPLASLRIFPMK